MIERVRADAASAFRALRASPATAIAVALTIAVSAGMNQAIVGLVDRALLSPPPHVASPDRLFTLGFEHSHFDGQRVVMSTTSYGAFETIRDSVPAAATTAAWHRASMTAVLNGDQVQTQAMLVSGAYFSMLDAGAAFGRTIGADDDREPAGSPIVVLSHGFWMSAFAGDRGVLGRHLAIDGQDLQVAGVMPAGFSGHATTRVDLWIPLHAGMAQSPEWDRDHRNVVEVGLRLDADATQAAASTQAGAAMGDRVVLTAIHGTSVAATESTIAYWLLALSMLVLVIGLANTGTLFLVRGARRRREYSIRAALGASRGRLLSEAVIEAAMLAAVAIAAAVALAGWFDEGVRKLLFPSLIEASGVTPRAVAAGAAAGVCTLLLAGGVAAAQITAVLRTENLAHAARSPRRLRAQTPLLLVQTTLAMILLAGAGLFGRSLYNLASQDFGMRMNDVLLVRFAGGPGFVPGQDQLFGGAIDRVRALPGVAQATPIKILPFTGFNVPPISVPGLAEPPNIGGQLPFLIAATSELFDVLGLQIVEGRRLTAADMPGAPVAIVNETMARTVWPGRSALGRCFRIGFDPAFDPSTAAGPPSPPLSAPCLEVVGVVRDVRQRSVVPTDNEARLMQYYVPFGLKVMPGGGGPMPQIHGLLVRTDMDADSLAAPIRRLVIGNRTDLPFLNVRPYAELLDSQMRPWRTGTALLALFSALALVVSAIGLYAAFAHSVAERRHEMAVRIAIGARPAGVLLMILREAARLAVAGIVCGWIVAALAGRWTQSMLFGTTAADPLVLGAGALLMLAVAAAATFLPARTAALSDPSALLRAE